MPINCEVLAIAELSLIWGSLHGKSAIDACQLTWHETSMVCDHHCMVLSHSQSVLGHDPQSSNADLVILLTFVIGLPVLHLG